MKHLLIFVVMLTPATAQAQQVNRSGQPVKRDSLPISHEEIKDEVGSESFKFRGGYVIGQPSFLYRTLRDAQRGHYVHRVRPGDKVYSHEHWSASPWIRVARDTYSRKAPIPVGCDTTIYYLRSAALVDKKGGISAFSF